LEQSINGHLCYFPGDTYGRRFTNSVSFLIAFVTCLPIIVYATDERYESLMIYLATFIKFLNALTFFTANLQCLEIYPTCMRQTGVALGTILANAIGVLAPYLVYLGTTVDIRAPYYILGVLFLLGGIGALFLPETLHKKLPDTMEEARHFGQHDVSAIMGLFLLCISGFLICQKKGVTKRLIIEFLPFSEYS